MNLSRRGREQYQLQITTSPALTDWEASFDDGATWDAGTPATVDGVALFQWLVAGPDATAGSAVAVITVPTAPLIRATSSPEIIVRAAPTIRLVR